MNITTNKERCTTADDLEVQRPNHRTTSALGQTLRRRFALLLLATTAAIGLTAVAARPVAAADNTSYGRVCPYVANNYSTKLGPYLAAPVYVDAYVPGYGVYTLPQTLYTSQNSGCVLVPLVSGYHFRVRVDYRYYGTWYRGNTAWMYIPDGYTVNNPYPFGSFPVYFS